MFPLPTPENVQELLYFPLPSPFRRNLLKSLSRFKQEVSSHLLRLGSSLLFFTERPTKFSTL